ncbi:MAG: Glutathione S-transferase, omega, partial [uncultured Gemmatimonadaceae bacterium]
DRNRAVPRRDERHRGVRAPAVLDPRPDHRRRLVGVPGRGRPVPPVRVARLPVGAPRDHRAAAAGARGGDLDVGGGPRARRARVGVPRGAGPRARHGVQLPVPLGGVPAHRPRVHRAVHRALHLGPRARAAGDQQLPRHHDRLRDAVHRLPPPGRAGALPGGAARGDRRGERPRVRRREQRRVQGGVRGVAGGVRRGGAGAVRAARLARGAARDAALPRGRAAHRGRRPPLHHARAVRQRVRGALQVQRAAPGGLPQPLGVRARPVRAPRVRLHGGPRPHQAPLLHDPRAAQPLAHRARRPGHRLGGAARPRAARV